MVRLFGPSASSSDLSSPLCVREPSLGIAESRFGANPARPRRNPVGPVHGARGSCLQWTRAARLRGAMAQASILIVGRVHARAATRLTLAALASEAWPQPSQSRSPVTMSRSSSRRRSLPRSGTSNGANASLTLCRAGVQITPQTVRLLRQWGLGDSLGSTAAEPIALTINRFDGRSVAHDAVLG